MSDDTTGGPLDWLRGLGRSTPAPVAPDPTLPKAGPKVEDRPGGQNRYTIKVPSDGTTLSLGRAGMMADSGITGTTARHVHFDVTEGTPTSVSLGSPRSAGGVSSNGFTVETQGEMNLIGQDACMLSSRLQCRIVSDEKSVQIDAGAGSIDCRSDTADSVVYSTSTTRTDNGAASIELASDGILRIQATEAIELIVGASSVKVFEGAIIIRSSGGANLAVVGDTAHVSGRATIVAAEEYADISANSRIDLNGGARITGNATKIEWNPS